MVRKALCPGCWVLCHLLLPLATEARVTSGDRSDAFIGYHESRADCKDQLDTCQNQAKNGACLTEPYAMRRFCPITCNVDRCTNPGSLKMKHRGHATPQGTALYAQMMDRQHHGGQTYRKTPPKEPSASQLTLSSLGVGTYLGGLDTKTNELVTTAVIYSVARGWNVIDTASNYRYGLAEASVGRALDNLLAGRSSLEFSHDDPARKDLTRDMVFISTKAGFTTKEVVDKMLKAGSLPRQDLVSDMHSIHPAYLRESLDLSLERMGLEAVDLLYLHNAAEMQLPAVGREAFMARLRHAFNFLEAARGEGKLRYYGLATWDCFRQPPGSPLHLSLEEVVGVAREVAGPHHGFKFVQLPINAAMPEAWLRPWQYVGGHNMSFAEAAQQLGVGVFSSGPLMEAELVKKLTGQLDGVKELVGIATTPGKLLQWARSTPGLVTALVGHKTREFVEHNVKLSALPLMTPQQFHSAWPSIEKEVQRMA